LDIGFGTGDSLVHMASSNKDTMFIGVEIMRSGLATVLQRVKDKKLENIRLVRSDVTRLCQDHLLPSSFNKICVYFPDPWPNAERDGNRRIIRPKMVDLFHSLMKPNAELAIATDADFYAEHVRRVFEQTQSAFVLDHYEEHAPCEASQKILNMRGTTKYEKRALSRGTDFVYEFVFRKVAPRNLENEIEN